MAPSLNKFYIPLAAAFEPRLFLYNIKYSEYKKQPKKVKAWKEVAPEVEGIKDAENAKNTWINLRKFYYSATR